MKKILFISLIALAFLGRSYAQTNTGKSINASFDVSPSGGLTYQVPFELPSYVLGHFPNLGLTYNSQAGDGVAGYGWNISGVSSITRIAATKYHDGFIDPVDFDWNDRFSLDGQRLILKNGEYGKAGSLYETESVSNIKIEAIGTFDSDDDVSGPDHFIVTHPNGMQYRYDGISRLEYSLTKVEDPNGNTVIYNYYNSGSNIRISSIEDPIAKVKVVFNYVRKDALNPAAIGGNFYVNWNLLTSVNVLVNNTENYYTYELEHETTSKGIKKTKEIKQKNKENEYLPSITFNYPEPRNYQFEHEINALDLSIGGTPNSTMLSGEFSGDEYLDYIGYNNDRNNSSIFQGVRYVKGLDSNKFKSLTFTQTSLGGAFDYLLTGTYIDSYNEVSNRQGMILIREESDKVVFDIFKVNPDIDYPRHQHRFNWNKNTSKPTVPVGALRITQTPNDTNSQQSSDDIVASNIINLTNVPAIYTAKNGIWLQPGFHSKAGSNFHAKITGQASYDGTSLKYISGDFNGDGITDVVAISKSSQVYLIDLNSINNYSATLIGKLKYPYPAETTDRILTGDFNGDGKMDLYHKHNGELNVYTLNKNNELNEPVTVINSSFNNDNYIGLGDFNGDGKTDVFNSIAEGSSTWRFYFSNGINFDGRETNIGVIYNKNKVGNASYHCTSEGKCISPVSSYYNYHYLPVDFDKDGKTDIIKHTVIAPGIEGYSEFSRNYVYFYTNNSLTPYGTPSISFENTQTIAKQNEHSPLFGHPSVAQFENRNLTNQYVFIEQSGKIHTYHLDHNHREEVCLNSIENNGLKTSFEYTGIVQDDNDSSYRNYFGDSYAYPYKKINFIRDFKLVKHITQTFDNLEREQRFKYGGLLSSLDGRGVLGFNFMARTNWFNGEVSDIWTLNEFDHKKRGQIVESLTQLSPGGFIFEYRHYWGDMSRVNYTYDLIENENKTFISRIKTTQTTDILKDITSSSTNTYDAYNNISETNITYPNGGKKITNTYFNNLSGTGGNYYLGRPKTSTERTTLGIESFETSKEYKYTNNQLSELKTRGNGTSWLTEKYEHDSFGNINKKSISGEGITRSTETKHDDTTGRFIEWTKNTEGLKTTYTYDKNKGLLSSKTDPFGKTESYKYDSWNRIIEQKDYLGNTVSSSYEGLAGGGWKTISSNSFGGTTENHANRMGWTFLSKEKNTLGQWVSTAREYDAVGKTTKTSEPYFTNATQWSTSHYDEYNRLYIQQLYTGRRVETTYYESQIFTEDELEKVTNTYDAVGNIIKHEDLGGAITYTYHANNTPKLTTFDGHTIETKIDGWGRKIELNDPAAGIYKTEYNIFGEVTKQITPEGTSTYIYNNLGDILQKTIVGTNTDVNIQYTYHPINKQISAVQGNDNINNSSYSYNYEYDSNHRPIKSTEIMPLATFEKRNTYDIYGRLDTKTYKSTLTSGSSEFSEVKIKNHYHPNSGQLYKIGNLSTGKTLYQATSLSARGQVLTGITNSEYKIDNSFDAYGLPTKRALNHYFGLEGEVSDDFDEIVTVRTNFDNITGNLTNRNNSSFSGGSEYFEYDDLDRLTKISGAYNHTQSYEANGNIETNSSVGTYNYEEASKYRVHGIDLNTTGENHYQNHAPQQITYNADKKPVSIYEEANGRVDFEYGILGKRSIAYYGGLNANKLQRDYTKIYSAIIPAEIEINKTTNAVKFITYTQGDAYSAPLAHIKQTGTNAINDFMYLFRDHLGSILSIIDGQGTIHESTHYGAWGKIKEFSNRTGATTFNYANSLLGRGYTGHEHFTSVGLIHMNGRMYDANLGRFLSPDNYIQDPFNTQNFNRYGYVLNNPLKFVDPTGELSWASIGKWIAVNAKVITAVATIAAAVTATVLTAGLASPLLAGAIVGASAGFVGGAVGTWTQGGSFLDGLAAGGIQGAFGAITGGVGGAIGAAATKTGMSIMIGTFKSTSPVLNGFLVGTVSGGASGFATGALGAVFSGNSSNWLQAGLYGAATGGAIGGATGSLGGYIQAKKLGINPWTGIDKKQTDWGKFPGDYIDTEKIENTDMPNSTKNYTTSNGKPISKALYNQNGKLEFQFDYKVHNMGFKHGHEFTIPGNFQSGHKPENHIPFMKITSENWFRLNFN